MEIKEFENGLIVKSRKSAVIFEANLDENQGHGIAFVFKENDFQEFIQYIELIANKSWSNLTPKEAQSEASDYWEYYDRQLDNNGYLRIDTKHLLIDRPSLESNRLYQFNKRKMESFLYDLKKKAIAECGGLHGIT